MVKSQMTPVLSPLKGSYELNDCQFLLEEVNCEYSTIEEKEMLIQSGKRHYSELLSQEAKPTDEYQKLFFDFTERYKVKLASHIYTLAKHINDSKMGPIVIVSLARAGTPIGVLVKKALIHFFSRDCVHYSISIIRDRGIDAVALDYIVKIKRHDPASLLFLDGWTAKGVITEELKRSIIRYNVSEETEILPELYVVSDTGGVADYCATREDYPIPSSMLNSTVSGLISRSIWKDPYKDAFHGCVINTHLENVDHSQWFVDTVFQTMKQTSLDCREVCEPMSRKCSSKDKMSNFIGMIAKKYSVIELNHIKPGIAESTRVMLRRVPSLLLVKSLDNQKIRHLLMLAKEKKIRVLEDPSLLFEACALIKTLNLEEDK
ncbi:cysteine protease StiP domain-containing protein [Vibrio mexicanus]|uniref:cysteine protease StiP domain-containing protein n=1 Tax=Vibrio mexicanus TaxID=1004326 RepID=UPI000B015BEC|nr:cysteine protease StiP domain-containing protein [Vibrio mexicanus]